jgi:hypothetical protein
MVLPNASISGAGGESGDGGFGSGAGAGAVGGSGQVSLTIISEYEGSSHGSLPGFYGQGGVLDIC